MELVSIDKAYMLVLVCFLILYLNIQDWYLIRKIILFWLTVLEAMSANNTLLYVRT